MGTSGWSITLGVVAGCALAACSFAATGASPGVDAPPPDAPVTVICALDTCRLRVDTEAEWRAGTTLQDGAIELDPGALADPASAALTPAAYVRGAVIARGSTNAYGASGAVDWAAIEASAVDGVTFGPPDLPSSSAAPVAAGVTTNDQWTYWVEGEIELPAGVTTFELFGDDFAALQLAPPHTRAFSTLLTATHPNRPRMAFDAGAGGWFPFRAAVVQSNGGFSGLEVRLVTGSTAAPIPRARLRGRVDGLRGAFVIAWDDRELTGPATASLYTRELLDDEIDQPRAPGLTSSDDLTQRWFGQYHAAAAGAHQLTATTDDGARLWLGGQASPDQLAVEAPSVSTAVSADLRVGWNDLVIDYQDTLGGEFARLALTQAPAGVATGGRLPVARLRPVLPRGHGVVTHFDGQDSAIPNSSANGVLRTVDLSALGAETVTEVRVGYTCSHGSTGELSVRLRHGAREVLLRDNTSGACSRTHVVQDFDGDPLAGGWILDVRDDGGGATGTLTGWSLTVLTTGGPGHVAERTEWISDVQDLAPRGEVAAFGPFEAGARIPAGAGIALYVRTCTVAADCAATAWSGPYAVGDPVGVEPARHAQVRVVLTSNGGDEPALDRLDLPYSVIEP